MIVDAHRCFWTADYPWRAGTDWPVRAVVATYEQVMDVLTVVLGGRPAGIFGCNTARVYRWEL